MKHSQLLVNRAKAEEIFATLNKKAVANDYMEPIIQEFHVLLHESFINDDGTIDKRLVPPVTEIPYADTLEYWTHRYVRAIDANPQSLSELDLCRSKIATFLPEPDKFEASEFPVPNRDRDDLDPIPEEIKEAVAHATDQPEDDSKPEMSLCAVCDQPNVYDPASGVCLRCQTE